jgi:hypothetical protein
MPRALARPSDATGKLSSETLPPPMLAASFPAGDGFLPKRKMVKLLPPVKMRAIGCCFEFLYLIEKTLVFAVHPGWGETRSGQVKPD